MGKRVNSAVEEFQDHEPLAHAGRSILGMIWEQLDDAMNNLMAGNTEGFEEDLLFLKGTANGLATAIMFLQQNPYEEYDIDFVKAEALERYEQRQERRSAAPETDECLGCGSKVEIRVDEAYDPGTLKIHNCGM